MGIRKWKTAKELKEKYPMIPIHMLESIVHYRDHGRPEGSFAEALLSNDLMGAFGKADSENTEAMHQWASLLYNDMPMASKGSPAAYLSWCKNGGLYGYEEQRKENENE